MSENKIKKIIDVENISDFQYDLTNLINKHKLERFCNTPDFLISQHLTGCFKTYCKVLKTRDSWISYDKIYKDE